MKFVLIGYQDHREIAKMLTAQGLQIAENTN